MAARLIPIRPSAPPPDPTEVRLHTAPNGSRPTTLIAFCAAVAFIALCIIGALEARSAADDDTSHRTKPPRLIHTHGSSARETASVPASVDAIAEQNVPGMDFDDGELDELAVRNAMFDTWRMAHQEEWSLMDSTIRTCARMRYVNAFGRSVEESIDECLDHFEDYIDYE